MPHVYLPEEGVKAPGTHVIGITISYEPSCGCRELYLGHLQKQQVLLTPEPSL